MKSAVDISAAEAIFLLAAVGLFVRLIIWYANVNADRKAFKAFIAKIEKRIAEIFDRLNRFGRSDLVGSSSPLNLTSLGKEGYAEIEASAIADKMAEALKKQITNESPYEIQQLCFDWVTEDKLTETHKKLVHETACQRGLTVLQTMEVIAIELRERLLTQEQRDTLPQVTPPPACATADSPLGKL